MYQISIHKKVNAFTIIYMLSIFKLSIYLIAYIASLNMTSMMIISLKYHMFQLNHIVSLNEFDLQHVATKPIDMFRYDVISV